MRRRSGRQLVHCGQFPGGEDDGICDIYCVDNGSGDIYHVDNGTCDIYHAYNGCGDILCVGI